MMTGKLLIVLICCIFFLLLSLYYDKDMRRTKHKHEYEKVLYYIEDSRGDIELYKGLYCSCGKWKNSRYITTKYTHFRDALSKVKREVESLGYFPKEIVESKCDIDD